jgi:hypothetical protein
LREKNPGWNSHSTRYLVVILLTIFSPWWSFDYIMRVSYFLSPPLGITLSEIWGNIMFCTE